MSSGARQRRAVQRSFDELGTALCDVTFCVIDLETTGGSPTTCAITEVGAVKVRGGKQLATFQTLVNPGAAIPPTITYLTGICDQMVVRAPRIEGVLPSLLEFIGNDVIVGHNVRFDLSFIQAALGRSQRPLLTNPTIDTVALARRLVRDEVPNCKLGTLAQHLRLDHRPSHRALDDAAATADLLHLLIGRATSLGVSGLDDLRALPTLAGSAELDKLRLTERLPRCPGVYLFRDRSGQVLYVGKATNLRARVRQYFSTDGRRKVAALLRETQRIDHKRCSNELEAAVLECRLIHHLEPRFNRQGTRGRSAAYIVVRASNVGPRLAVARRAPPGAAVWLGPLPSQRVARTVVEAVSAAVALRRDRAALDLDAFVGNPSLLVDPLWDHMERLGADGRFEAAAAARDRIATLIDALDRRRRVDALRAASRLVCVDHGGIAVEIRRGRLTRLHDTDAAGLRRGGRWREVEALPDDPGGPDSGPLSASVAAEVLLISRWLDRHTDALDLRYVGGRFESRTPWVAGRVEVLAALRRPAATHR